MSAEYSYGYGQASSPFDDPWNKLKDEPGMPARLQLDARELLNRGCMVIDPGDVTFISQSLQAQDIKNSPNFTLVHSTTPSTAYDIMRKGLEVKSYHKDHLGLHHSNVRLYSPTDTNADYADRWNTFALAYRYATDLSGGNGFDRSRSAKVVIQFPFSGADLPQVGKALAQGTPLEAAKPSRRFAEKSGRHVRIRPEFVRGFLSLDSKTFEPNPNFNLEHRVGLGKVLRWQ